MKPSIKKGLMCLCFAAFATKAVKAQVSNPWTVVAEELRKENKPSPLNPFNHRPLTAAERQTAQNAAAAAVTVTVALGLTARRRRCI